MFFSLSSKSKLKMGIWKYIDVCSAVFEFTPLKRPHRHVSVLFVIDVQDSMPEWTCYCSLYYAFHNPLGQNLFIATLKQYVNILIMYYYSTITPLIILIVINHPSVKTPLCIITSYTHHS